MFCLCHRPEEYLMSPKCSVAKDLDQNRKIDQQVFMCLLLLALFVGLLIWLATYFGDDVFKNQKNRDDVAKAVRRGRGRESWRMDGMGFLWIFFGDS